MAAQIGSSNRYFEPDFVSQRVSDKIFTVYEDRDFFQIVALHVMRHKQNGPMYSLSGTLPEAEIIPENALASRAVIGIYGRLLRKPGNRNFMLRARCSRERRAIR